VSDAGFLDTAFRLSALAAGAGAAVCLVLAARARRASSGSLLLREGAGPPAMTRELIWTLVPPALLAVLLLIGHA